MLDKAFVQTGVDGSWVECLDNRLAHEELEKLACAIFLACDDDQNQHWFKFYRYRENYADNFDVGTPTENQEIFDWASDQADIVGFGHSFIRQYDWWKPQIVPVRWRIFQKSPEYPLYLAVDVARVQQERNGAEFHYETFSINVSMDRGVSIVSHTGYKSRGRWTDKTDIDIPENISAAVVEALRDSTKVWCGIRPAITWPLYGKEAVLAYIAHPFDWNVSVFQQDIGDDYKALFPREQKDNFRALCKYLSIPPTKSLRRAYAKNPYVIFWHLLLKGYGVEDLNLIQKFYKFDQGIVGIPFSDIHLKNGKVSIPRNNSTYIDWLPLEHYLRWLEKNKSQRAMVNELYRWAKKGINQEMYDTLSQFAQYETALPESLRQMLLRRGLTREVHDLISEAVLELNPNTRNRILLYTPEDYALEYQIGDYEFRLVRQTHDLSIIGRQMHNCVASYREQALFGESIIMTAKKDGNYVICIELDAEHHLYQAYGPHNQELSGDDLIACGAWIKRCQIQISTLWFHLGDTSEADGWKIFKLPTEEILPKMTRDEISRVTKNGVSYGYYSSMAVILEEKRPYCISAPPWKTFASEREYLQYVFPEGKSVWTAAMEEEDIDAQYALGICYAHGKIMPRDTDRALAWLKRPAEEGNVQARMLCQKIQCDNARMNGTYDDRIREGLRLAKLRMEMKQALRTA